MKASEIRDGFIYFLRSTIVQSRLKCKRLLMRNLLIAILSVVSFSAIAQDQMATGKITNPRGEPVSFATITVKGTKTTTVAEADGTFKIKAAPGKTLIVSAASYTQKEFYLNTLSGNDLVLQPGQA